MTAILRAAPYAALAVLGWFALIVAVGMLIHGRAWVWARARETLGRTHLPLPAATGVAEASCALQDGRPSSWRCDMVTELQRALARYETARGRYRLAVLGSFSAPGRGDVIRAAIGECQEARAALRRLGSPEPELGLHAGTRCC